MLYEKVVRLCTERGISIRALERETGIGHGTIQGWTNSWPRLDVAMRVAKFFGVTLDALVEE